MITRQVCSARVDWECFFFYLVRLVLEPALKTPIRNCLESSLIASLVLVLFVHIADCVLKNQKVRARVAVHFDAVLVVPFDNSVKLLPILQDHNHRCLVLHLLEIVKAFGIGLLLWCGLLLLSTHSHFVFNFRQGRTDKLSVHEKILLRPSSIWTSCTTLFHDVYPLLWGL